MNDGVPPVLAVLLDDDSVDRERLGGLLSTGKLTVVGVGPTSQGDTVAAVADLLGEVGPRIVLVDYRLDDGDERSDFRGASVAAALREADRTVDVPLVLLTTEEKLRTWVKSRPGMSALFDWHLLKSDVSESGRRAAQNTVVSLAIGYWTLATQLSAFAGWDRVAAAMAASREELAGWEMLETYDPLEDSTPDIARWIHSSAMKWPGPLIDEARARVTLGVTNDGLREDAVQRWLDEFRYSGVFSALEPRVWAAPLRQAVLQLAGPGAPVDSTRRVAALSREVGIGLDAEGCTWCGEPRTIHACAVCGEAVDAVHSIRRMTDRRPAWADASVVCFACIARGEAEAAQFAPDATGLVLEIQAGEVTRPNAGDGPA